MGQIEAQARDARRRTSGSRRGNQPEFELRWLLVGLSSIWERRLGREHQPRSTKRGTLSDFVSSIVAIADPPLPIGTARSVLSMIRKSKKAPEFFAAPIRRNKH